MKKYNWFLCALLLLCVLGSCHRQFKLKTQDFDNFYADNSQQITRKFTEGIYISQICKQTVLATDNRSSLIAFEPCGNPDIRDFNDPEVKQTIALIFLDDNRFLYCTDMQENGRLVNTIDLTQKVLKCTKNYRPDQSHLFRGYYHVVDTTIVLEMELPEQPRENQKASKITVKAIFKEEQIHFQSITHVKDKSNILLTDSDLNEIDLKRVFGFTPTFAFHEYQPSLKEENIYIRPNEKSTTVLISFRKQKKVDLESGKMAATKDTLMKIFNSFQWDSVQVIVNRDLGQMAIYHHITWLPVFVKIRNRNDSIRVENKKAIHLIDSHKVLLPALCLDTTQKNKKQIFNIILNDSIEIDASLKPLFAHNVALTNYILKSHRYSKLTRQNYGECQHFIFDNNFKPIEIEIDQTAASELYKTHLYIGAPLKSNANEVDSIFTEGNIRNYKLLNGTIIKENINIRDSVRTW